MGAQPIVIVGAVPVKDLFKGPIVHPFNRAALRHMITLRMEHALGKSVVHAETFLALGVDKTHEPVLLAAGDALHRSHCGRAGGVPVSRKTIAFFPQPLEQEAGKQYADHQKQRPENDPGRAQLDMIHFYDPPFMFCQRTVRTVDPSGSAAPERRRSRPCTDRLIRFSDHAEIVSIGLAKLPEPAEDLVAGEIAAPQGLV